MGGDRPPLKSVYSGVVGQAKLWLHAWVDEVRARGPLSTAAVRLRACMLACARARVPACTRARVRDAMFSLVPLFRGFTDGDGGWDGRVVG